MMLLTFFTPATVDDSNLFLFPPEKVFFSLEDETVHFCVGGVVLRPPLLDM